MNRPALKKSMVIILLSFTVINAKQPKIVGLVTARNEKIMIENCLRGLSRFTDAIVLLDDASTDNTVEIVYGLADECSVKTVIEKEFWYRDEPGDRNKLLNAGRALGGTHFIMLDADEMFTANLVDNNYLRETVLSLAPGDTLLLNWIQLWRSVNQYRFDKSVWTYNYKGFAFCDDGQCSYSSDFIHTARTPRNLTGTPRTIEGYTYGVLHFQFVNWGNLLIKQAWYRCLEHIRQPEKPTVQINALYAPSKDETGLGLALSPYAWFRNYRSFFNPAIFDLPEVWHQQQIMVWFNEYGTEYFSDLDIWDIEWPIKQNKKRSPESEGNISKNDISQYIPSNPVILEAGAHNGSDTREMLRIWPTATIFAFEPIPSLYKALIKNTKSYPNVHCFQTALSDINGTAVFYVSSGASDASSSLLQPQEHLTDHPNVAFNTTISVVTQTLDSWADENGIDSIDFMWLDMQGSELAVLKASPHIMSSVQAIYTEVSLHETYTGVPLYAEVRQWMESQGFVVVWEGLPWDDMGNILFVREKK